MGSEAARLQLRIFFFPYMAAGHMIPMLDMAKLFARRGVASTIITTPSNTALVASTIHRANSNSNSNSISLLCLPLPPPADTGLPDGWDASASIGHLDFQSVHRAISLLRRPLHHLLADHQPDCLISDMFLPWTADIAHELGIPRLVFHGMCFFSLCVLHLLELYRPQDDVSSNDEPFIVPGLPHPIEMTRSQLPAPLKSDTEFNRLLKKMNEAEAKSYGVVVNSCHEMEPHYAQHYTSITGKKAWCVGPVSLCKESSTAYELVRASKDHGGCLAWLDSKMPGSVLYVCFGSLIQFTEAQLREIALGLEASGRAFVWVVRAHAAEVADRLAEGVEERTEGRGMIIRGWAPQTLILNHEAVGGFLTHCGWNSVLEGASAGVPMITWPIFADQSFNEKLVVDVLEIGARVGARIAGEGEEEVVVKSEKIERAVDWVMGSGEEADRRRRRARRLGELARGAVAEGGSSYKDLGGLVRELMVAPKRLRESDLAPSSEAHRRLGCCSSGTT